jgi:hypothetical protein
MIVCNDRRGSYLRIRRKQERGPAILAVRFRWRRLEVIHLDKK